MPSRRKHQAAFTLVEVMVVIVIIGLLAALILPKLVGQSTYAMRQVAKADIRTLATQVELFKLQQGRYPGSLDELVSTSPSGGAGDGYISELPKDPWKNPYLFRTPGAGGKGYDVISLGADGAEGGTGEGADISNHNLKEE